MIDTTKLRELAQSFVTQGAPKWEIELAANEIDRLRSDIEGAAECLSNQRQTIARLLEIEKAARNLAKVKGRHNSELAMNQLLEALK